MKKLDWVVVVACCIELVFFIHVALADGVSVPKPDPLTITERLALKALQERQQSLSEDVKAFSGEVCRARGIMVMEECNIDPQGMTVSRVPKKEEPKK